MKIYTTNVMSIYTDDPEEHATKIFLSIDKAEQYLSNAETEWLRKKKSDGIYDIEDYLEDDICGNNCIYKRYCTESGYEQVFEMIEEEECDVRLYIVKEDYRYMNNQCEIGSNIHIVTTSFTTAYEKAVDLRNETQKNFSQSEYEENEYSENDSYSYTIIDENDIVKITVSQYKLN